MPDLVRPAAWKIGRAYSRTSASISASRTTGRRCCASAVFGVATKGSASDRASNDCPATAQADESAVVNVMTRELVDEAQNVGKRNAGIS